MLPPEMVPRHIEYFKFKAFEKTAEGRGKVTDLPACFLNFLQLKTFNMPRLLCSVKLTLNKFICSSSPVNLSLSGPARESKRVEEKFSFPAGAWELKYLKKNLMADTMACKLYLNKAVF